MIEGQASRWQSRSWISWVVRPDLVILPVGGGGLASGVTGYLRDEAPQTGFRFVEPLGGASLTAALQQAGR